MSVSTYRERYFCMTPEEAAAIAAKNRTDSLESELKIRRELADLDKKQLEYLQSFDTLSVKQNLAVQQLKLQLKNTVDLEKAEKKRLETAMSLADTSRKRAAAELKIAEQEIELAKAKLKNGEIEKADLDEKNKKFKELEDQIDKAEQTTQGLIDGFGSLLKGDLTGGLSKLGSSLTINLKNKLMDKFTDSIFSLAKAGPKGAAALGGLAAAFVVIGVAVAVWTKIAKMAIAVVDASNAFQKATGTSNEFASSIITVGNEARAFGGTVEEVSASFQTLFAGVSDFTMMSKSAREELIKTNTVLSKLGISNDDLAKSQQNLIKAMGQTATQAAATSRELAAFASDIGVAPSKMASDFAAAGGQLAKFGRDGVKAFKDLAQTSKITGIEVNRLLAITGKFDTFDGAAEQAGRLNAALGGNFVNAMELLTETDPTARFKQMTGAIKDAGKSFDEMTYFEAKFFAEAMGLQDVNELALALSGNMDMVGKFTKKSSAEYEALAERAAKVQSFQEKMNTLMAQLIPIVEPIVDGLMAMSDWMSENLDAVAFGFKVIISAVTGLAVALTAVGISMALAFAPVYGATFAIAGLVGAIGALGSLLFIESFASSFLEGLIKVGNAIGFIGDGSRTAAGDINSLTADASKLAKNGLFGSQGLKVASEATTKNIEEMSVAMKDASVGVAAAPTKANTYAMSQVGDTISTNTQNYAGSREPMNINLNVDGKKLAFATVGPMMQAAGQS